MLTEIIRAIGTVLFPPAPEELRVRELGTENVLSLLQPYKVKGIVTLCSYADQDMRALILRTKYHRDKHAAMLLGYILAQYLKNTNACDRVIIPVPLSERRFRERGYNQITAVIEHAQEQLPALTIRDDLLIRTRNTKRQTDLPRSKRLANVSNAFAATDLPIATNTPVLLIDDVLTTGATLTAAREALEVHGYRNVKCLALAH